jgi:hypothetical protein
MGRGIKKEWTNKRDGKGKHGHKRDEKSRVWQLLIQTAVMTNPTELGNCFNVMKREEIRMKKKKKDFLLSLMGHALVIKKKCRCQAVWHQKFVQACI